MSLMYSVAGMFTLIFLDRMNMMDMMDMMTEGRRDATPIL